MILEIKAAYYVSFGALISLVMAEHNTHSKTIDDAILCLTHNQSLLTTAQNELHSKLNSILSQLSQVALPDSQPPSPSQPSTFHLLQCPPLQWS